MNSFKTLNGSGVNSLDDAWVHSHGSQYCLVWYVRWQVHCTTNSKSKVIPSGTVALPSTCWSSWTFCVLKLLLLLAWWSASDWQAELWFRHVCCISAVARLELRALQSLQEYQVFRHGTMTFFGNFAFFFFGPSLEYSIFLGIINRQLYSFAI